MVAEVKQGKNGGTGGSETICTWWWCCNQLPSRRYELDLFPKPKNLARKIVCRDI